jgi:hypothetical protein
LSKLTSKVCSALAAAAAMYVLYQKAACASFVLSRTAPFVCSCTTAAVETVTTVDVQVLGTTAALS